MDDLDAFFDDVETAVEEVRKADVNADNTNEKLVGESTQVAPSSTAAAADTTSQIAHGASQFGNVENKGSILSDVHVQQYPDTGKDPESEHARPAKRAKVVVAASASAMSSKRAVVAAAAPALRLGAATSSISTPLPPPLPAGPPPPPSQTGQYGNFGSNGVMRGGPHQPPPPPPLPPHPPNAPVVSGGTLNHRSVRGDRLNVVMDPPKNHVRSAAGETWLDPTLEQWPENDYRLFVGNLAKDLRQHHLEEAFSKYSSFAMARILFNKHDGKSRGYGFISVMDPKDCARAIREMDQSWLGSRPIKVKLSEWKERQWKEVKKKDRKGKRDKKRFGF